MKSKIQTILSTAISKYEHACMFLHKAYLYSQRPVIKVKIIAKLWTSAIFLYLIIQMYMYAFYILPIMDAFFIHFE